MPDTGAPPPRPGNLSLKARLASVLFLASLPGIVLGVLEAGRAYVSAAQAERDDVTRTARQTANRAEEVVSGAMILAESLAQSPPVRIGSVSCDAILANAAGQSQRFAFISRLDRSGRVLCSSDAETVGSSLRDTPWFPQMRSFTRPAVAPAWQAPPSGEQVIPLSAPILNRDRAAGLVVVLLQGAWLITQSAADLEEADASIVLFDGAGAPFAVAARGLKQDAAVRAARRAVAGEQHLFGSLQAGVASISGGGLRVVVVRPTKAGALGARAAVITAAPLIAVAFSAVAVWLALQRWVLRWVDDLVASARSASQGLYRPADMTRAPDELHVLGTAFDSAVRTAGQRANDLAVELSRNRALTRELHHRVKNNIQVFMSALSRQIRRTDEPTVRFALAEARARLLPIALTYRHAGRPEDATRIDLAGYLGELARQIHAALDGAARGVDLSVECEPLEVSIDEAATIGMMAGECLTSACLSSSGMSTTALRLALRCDGEHCATLECGVQCLNPSHDASKMDEPLIRQLAQQLAGEVVIEQGPRFSLRWPLEARAEVRVSGA